MFSDLQEAARIFPCKQLHTTLKKKPNVIKNIYETLTEVSSAVC